MSEPRPTSRPPRRRRALTVVALLASSILILVGCTDDSEWRAAPSTDSADGVQGTQAQLLFVLTAASAGVELDGDDHSITLRRPSDVLVFTDRPMRAAQRTSVAELERSWEQLFGDDPPNAALSAVTGDGRSIDVPVELTDITSTDDGVRFRAIRLDDGSDTAIPAELDGVSLFIDDVACEQVLPAATCLMFESTYVPFDSSF